MTTLLEAWGQARNRLKAAGLDTPVLDARMLLEKAAGVDRHALVTDPYRVLPGEAVDALDSLVARRLAREPMSHIIGSRGFWTLDIVVTPDVLTPRPDSEQVVAEVLKRADRARALQILDLGVGSGALLLALLQELPLARGVGVDCSSAALDVAAQNAARTGLCGRVSFVRGDWGAGLDARFDIIVSNPPYIATAEIAELDPEVRDHEPLLALDGGPDGLSAYRAVLPHMVRLLEPRGLAALEIGRSQANAVTALAELAGLQVEAVAKDLGRRDRVVVARPRRRGVGGLMDRLAD